MMYLERRRAKIATACSENHQKSHYCDPSLGFYIPSVVFFVFKKGISPVTSGRAGLMTGQTGHLLPHPPLTHANSLSFYFLKCILWAAGGFLTLKVSGKTHHYWRVLVYHPPTPTPPLPEHVIVAVPLRLPLRVSPPASVAAANASRVPGHKVGSPGCPSSQIYVLTRRPG